MTSITETIAAAKSIETGAGIDSDGANTNANWP